ncbi:proline-rich protein 23A3-like [Peromyscus eremicus]|uniref:proline-rich protein 23A3-like n=1 Tax=Peromyscus eremicus TaxID=42410 RepID=UPI0027DB7441|nr:proline-rich protein 23A3-like [Peromyscus eremicus]
MPGVRPCSPTDNPLPCWALQPEGPKPAKRRRLHQCTCPGSQAQPDLEAPTRPASEQLTSTLFLPAGLALKLHLEGGNLLLEPEPDLVTRVTLPGHTIILVPEDLQDSHQPGQPGFLPSSQQEAALLEMPQDHQVSLQQGSSSPSASDTQGWGNTSDPHEETQGGLGDFLRPMPWMNAPSEPDWDMRVTIPGHTIMVPENLQDSTQTAQPGILTTSQQEAALLEM